MIIASHLSYLLLLQLLVLRQQSIPWSEPVNNNLSTIKLLTEVIRGEPRLSVILMKVIIYCLDGALI